MKFILNEIFLTVELIKMEVLNEASILLTKYLKLKSLTIKNRKFMHFNRDYIGFAGSSLS